MSETVSSAERAEIERACEQLVYAYSRALDLGGLSGAADFFAENASLARPMTPDQVIHGRETIGAALLTRRRICSPNTWLPTWWFKSRAGTRPRASHTSS